VSSSYREIVVRSGEKGKGRSFRAIVLAMSTAPIWDKHEATEFAGGRIRPAFVMLACHAQEAGPILANLRCGHAADLSGDDIPSKGQVFEMLKSVRYVWGVQRVSTEAGGQAVILTGRLPGVASLDPGMVSPDEPVQFLIVPPRERLELELTRIPADAMRRYGESIIPDALKKPTMDWKKPELDRESEEWRYAPALALWFCASMDRRISAPILPDPLFQMRLYVGALRSGIAGWSRRRDHYGEPTFGRSGPNLKEWGYASTGLAPGVACSATQDALRELLVEQVRAWNNDRDASGQRRGERLARETRDRGCAA
jgi:hypothetical protein